MSTTTHNPGTFGARFELAMKDIRRAGVLARRNVASCCRSCYDPQIADDQPIIWHFGGQGNRVILDDDGFGNYKSERSYSRWAGKYVTTTWSDREVDEVYFQHDNLVDENGLTPAGHAVMIAFAVHHIHIEWDMSQTRCIVVRPSLSTTDRVQAADSALALV
jgi:hypothetical protein